MPAIAVIPAHGADALHIPAALRPVPYNGTSAALPLQTIPAVNAEAAAAAAATPTVETTPFSNIAAAEVRFFTAVCNIYVSSDQPAFCQPHFKAANGPDVSAEWVKALETKEISHEKAAGNHADATTLPHIDADLNTKTRLYKLAYYIGKYVLQKHKPSPHSTSRRSTAHLPPLPLHTLLEPIMALYAAAGKAHGCPSPASNATQQLARYLATFDTTATSIAQRLNTSSTSSTPPSPSSSSNNSTTAPLRRRRADVPFDWMTKILASDPAPPRKRSSDDNHNPDVKLVYSPHVHFHAGPRASESDAEKVRVIRLGLDTLREFLEALPKANKGSASSSSRGGESHSEGTSIGLGAGKGAGHKGDGGRVKKVEAEAELEKRGFFKDLLKEFVAELRGETDGLDTCKMVGIQGDHDITKPLVDKIAELSE